MNKKILTRLQRESLYNIYTRKTGNDHAWIEGWKRSNFREYRKFRRTAQMDTIVGCVMIYWCNMWLGIEPDGYVHS